MRACGLADRRSQWLGGMTLFDRAILNGCRASDPRVRILASVQLGGSALTVVGRDGAFDWVDSDGGRASDPRVRILASVRLGGSALTVRWVMVSAYGDQARTQRRQAERPAAHAAQAQEGAPQLPDDIWLSIIAINVVCHGLRAAKALRKQARVSSVFARAAREHPDNNAPG